MRLAAVLLLLAGCATQKQATTESTSAAAASLWQRSEDTRRADAEEHIVLPGYRFGGESWVDLPDGGGTKHAIWHAEPVAPATVDRAVHEAEDAGTTTAADAGAQEAHKVTETARGEWLRPGAGWVVIAVCVLLTAGLAAFLGRRFLP